MGFRADLVEWLADHRHPLLTPLFQFFTFLGDVQGFVLIIALIYVAYDKRLATRLAVLTLVTMSVNHILKTLIHNPRPFFSDGSYRSRWLVSETTAAALATEFSTPSGHAMGGAVFYTYVYAVARSRPVRIACVFCLLLIGLSRPYLGVHYFEDVLSGWLLGVLIALLAVRYRAQIERRSTGIALARRVTWLLVAAGVVWFGTWAVGDWAGAGPPPAFVTYAGLLTGIVLGQSLEEQLVDFDPKGAGAGTVLMRYLICVALVGATIVSLDVVFDMVAPDTAPLGQALRYVRYTAAGLAGILVAPLVFVRVGLAAPKANADQRPISDAS